MCRRQAIKSKVDGPIICQFCWYRETKTLSYGEIETSSMISQRKKIIPVYYEGNAKAWMTSAVVVAQLRKWYTELPKEEIQIVLIVAKRPAHLKVQNHN